MLIGAAAGMFVAGCGNAKRDFRVNELNPLTERVATQRSVLAQTLRIARPHRARDAAVLRSQLAMLAATMRRIAAVRPPDGTHAQFQRYTRANAALLAALNRYFHAFARGTAAQLRAAGENALSAAGRADAAEAALKQELR
jgi:hypothetical protein